MEKSSREGHNTRGSISIDGKTGFHQKRHEKTSPQPVATANISNPYQQTDKHSPMTCPRARQLTDWCQTQLAELHGAVAPALALRPLSGDASFRRYFRLQDEGRSYVAVDAPPQQENIAAFIRIAGLLAAAGVHTPAVVAADIEAGFMLLEDLGDGLYLPTLRACQSTADRDRAGELYTHAIDALIRIQTRVEAASLEPYNREELRRELELFPEWFCEALLGVPPGAGPRRMLDRVFTLLEEAALAQPQVAVHRDYHSRNLILANDTTEGPGILDFQDAVIGAYTYDLVSLLRDCYIRWDDAFVRRWAGYYFVQAVAAGIVPASRSGGLQRDFDLMGVQRHLKVLGVFARLCIRDRKPGYLADIPLVIRYLLDGARPYPELQPLLAWFEDALLPVAPARLHHPRHSVLCMQ